MAAIKQLRLWGRGLRTTRLLKIVGSTLKCVVSKPWAICFRIKVKLLAKWSGTEKESPKVITFEPSVWRASKKCAIHLLPITATAILAALNIATYFIGAEYQGPTTTVGQGFDNLALQITAKLYELLIIASLSTVLMDVLRYELLYGSTGLPFGILTANTQFVNATYLISPEFRMNVFGLIRSKKWVLVPLLVVCTILALLAGPSSALLMIPQSHDDWDAGHATFYMAGTNESVWPTLLDQEYIGGTHCLSPNQSDLTAQLPSAESCIWWGSATIQEYFLSSVWGFFQNMPIQDEVISRAIHLEMNGPFIVGITGIVGYGVYLPACLYSNLFVEIWEAAKVTAPIAARGSLRKWANLQYRSKPGSTITMNSLLPFLKTLCSMSWSEPLSSVANETVYSQIPLNTTANNNSQVSSQWFAPEENTINITSFPEQNIPSAYLSIQVPLHNGTLGLSCTVDARWAYGQIIAQGAGQINLAEIYTAVFVPNWGPDFDSWRSVRLGIDWLNSLTPQLGNVTGWNSLSSTLTELGVDNSTGLMEDTWDNVAFISQLVVSATIVDGMSRAGYDRMESLQAPTLSDGVLDAILEGSYILNTDTSSGVNASDQLQMQWSILVTGLGYRANSLSYYLALALLFTYSIIALAHTIWIFYNRKTSTAWSSLADVVTLACKSTPPTSTLNNASAGVESYETFKHSVRIRVIRSGQNAGLSRPTGTTNIPNEVEMVFDAEHLTGNHEEVLVGQLY